MYYRWNELSKFDVNTLITLWNQFNAMHSTYVWITFWEEEKNCGEKNFRRKKIPQKNNNSNQKIYLFININFVCSWPMWKSTYLYAKNTCVFVYVCVRVCVCRVFCKTHSGFLAEWENELDSIFVENLVFLQQ